VACPDIWHKLLRSRAELELCAFRARDFFSLRRAAAVRGTLRAGRGHAALAPALSQELRPLLSFEIGPRAVEEIAAKLVAWLTLDNAERKRAKLALAEGAARRYSWEKVAKGVIAAAQGRLNELLRIPARQQPLQG
jgi:hypothetical protein